MVEVRVGFVAISHRSLADLSASFYNEFDGVLLERDGQISLTVYVDGHTPVEAACAAIRRLEELEFSIVRSDLDLVDGPEIADRLNVSRQAVQHWARGNRGSGFPAPFGFAGGKRLWAWSQIVEWANRTQKAIESPCLTLDEVAMVDAMLANRRRKAVAQPALRLDSMIGRGTSKGQAGTDGVDDYVSKILRSFT